MIPYGRQSINSEDIREVLKVLESDWITQGPAIDSFEKAVADYCGSGYAVAVSSGTAALHIACLAAGLGKGDILWTSPNSFVASANCALYCGAYPDFVDIDPHTYNISVGTLEAKLAEAEKDGCLPKIIIPVHFAGQSCEMEKVAVLAEKYGITIIEDACHAIGGKYLGDSIGSCRFSDMTVFSFHPVKLITTGEGGMVLTNSKDYYEKLLRLRSHGITRNEEYMTGDSHGPWYYQQIELGFNYRLTDIQAALGMNQIKRLDEFTARRNALAKRYNEKLEELPLVLPAVSRDNYSAFHLYVIRLHLDKIQKTHLDVFNFLRTREIGVNLHYIPIHTQPYYQQMGFKSGDYPEAEKYYGEAISLPIYYDLTDEQQDKVISALKDALL